MLIIHNLTDTNVSPQSKTFFNIRFGLGENDFLQVNVLDDKKNHHPFIICLQKQKQTTWPLAALNQLTQAGFALVLLDLPDDTFQANLKVKTATRWLLQHAYQFGLDPFRYVLLSLDQSSSQAGLTALITANKQAYSHEDVRVSPLHFRGAILMAGLEETSTLELIANHDLRRLPNLCLIQKQSDYAPQVAQALSQKADITCFNLADDCPVEVFTSPYLLSKVKAFCQECFKKK